MQSKEMFHLKLSQQDGAEYAILPGDPGRVEKIAQYLDNPRHVVTNREFTTWSGTLLGERVLVTSTGIGGPSAAIAVEELYRIGVRTMIRVGTCGGMQLSVTGGDLIIPNAAVRFEGTSREYMPPEYPAVPDFQIVRALAEAAEHAGRKYRVGVVQSKDSFYGQHAPERMPVYGELAYKWEAWKRAGCLASEMECAALFTVASVLKIRAGAVLSALWNQERKKEGMADEHVFEVDNSIQTAIEALKNIIKR